jgi:predicted  nucleic acid-binding Zn ribbon protein
MNTAQLRQKIDHQLNSLSPQWLVLVSTFLDSIQTLTTKNKASSVEQIAIKRNKHAQDLLKYANTWQGNDIESCLDFVLETRSESQF